MATEEGSSVFHAEDTSSDSSVIIVKKYVSKMEIEGVQ